MEERRFSAALASRVPHSFRVLCEKWVMGIIGACWARGSSPKSASTLAEDDRGIPRFKKRRVGHPALVLQMLKQMVSRNGWPVLSRAKGGDVRPQPFWQARYYDFNVWSEQKRVEKLRYIHRNPVKRGLVERPEEWLWSSFHHYLTGEEGVVEIESHWTATRRENQRIYPTVWRRDPA